MQKGVDPGGRTGADSTPFLQEIIAAQKRPVEVKLINGDHDVRCLDHRIDLFSFFQPESIG
jgi:hypothetical protein